MTKLTEVIDLISESTGWDPTTLTPDTRLSGDLGIDGDDADELMEEFVSRFAVDMTGYDHSRYFGPEATWSPFSIHPAAPLDSMTIALLVEAATKGRWLP